MPKTQSDFKMPTLENTDLYSYISIFIVSFLSSQFRGRWAKVWKWKQRGISWPVAQGGGGGQIKSYFQLLDSSLHLLNIAHVLSIVNLSEMKQILK